VGYWDDLEEIRQIWKVDRRFAPREDREAIERLAERREEVFAISAVEGRGLKELLAAVSQRLSAPRHVETLDLDFSDGKRRAWLFEAGVVEAERTTNDGLSLDVRWTDRQRAAFEGL
jgi:GTP-binding protein HflX